MFKKWFEQVVIRNSYISKIYENYKYSSDLIKKIANRIRHLKNTGYINSDIDEIINLLEDANSKLEELTYSAIKKIANTIPSTEHIVKDYNN